MVRIAVVQHVAHEILGTFHPLLKDAGFRIRYVNYGRGPHAPLDVRRYDALVILGGPMGVYEAEEHPHLKEEIAWIQEAIALDKPVLGICLGAQLIAAALGAEVKPSGTREIGWHDIDLTPDGLKDPVLGRFQAREKVFQWHGDTYELPSGAIHLATSSTCTQQAFRFGDRVYGLQFHLEVDKSQIERWLRLPANARDVESLGGARWSERIREENGRYLPRLERASRGVFEALLTLFAR